MRTKRSWIGALVAVNLILLTALVMQAYSLPSAVAQMRGGRGSFVCVTAKGSGQTYDILYMLDASRGELHALYPNHAGQLVVASKRDLRKDFERN